MASSNQHTEGHAHPAPFWILLGTGVALMFLTYITVAATYVDFGPTINLLLALAIATVKAALVVMFFMHMYWDKPMNAVIFIGSLLFVALFVIITLIDTSSYHSHIDSEYAPAIERNR